MKTTKKITKHPGGRPTKMTEDAVKKLESVFKLAVSDTTACRYADISRITYYDWLKKDEEFSNRMSKAKEYARLAAGNVVMDAIVKDKDVNTAKWWLEKKCPEEFAQPPSVAQQFNVGDKITYVIETTKDEKEFNKTPPESK